MELIRRVCLEIAADSSSKPPQPSATGGDAPIRLEPTLGLAVEELMARVAQGGRSCPASSTLGSTKRTNDPSIPCVTNIFTALLSQMAQNGPLNSLLQYLNSVSNKVIQPIIPYVNAITPNTRLNNLGLTPRSWASTVKLLCWMIYLNLTTEKLSSSIWDIPASALTDVSSSSSARPCPTGMFTPDCEYCNCIPGTNKCRGTKYGQYGGCYGNSPALPANQPYDSIAAIQQAVNEIMSMVPAKFNPNTPIPVNNRPVSTIYRIQWKQQATPDGNLT